MSVGEMRELGLNSLGFLPLWYFGSLGFVSTLVCRGFVQFECVHVACR